MIDISAEQRRQAFGAWLRTGRLPRFDRADGIEVKFNPYHDPFNGQFTFAPGGPRRGRGREPGYVRPHTSSPGGGQIGDRGGSASSTPPTGTGLETETGQALEAHLAPGPQRPVVGRGANIRAFEDPMTLEQSFPGLRTAPGGAIVAVADNLFDLTGPADAMTADVLNGEARRIAAEIKAIDPAWHYDEIVPADAQGNPMRTIRGLTAKVNDLRFHRAAVIARVRNDYKPLQVETLRFIQERANDAYDRGVALRQAGRLTPRLSLQEALGNFVDRETRRTIRIRYAELGINSAGLGPVRVNRRENITSGGELSYRRPDVRVDDVMFDVTIARKSVTTPQVRGFFDGDARPNSVVIIRPRQLGGTYTYIIPRPRTK